MRKFFTFMLLFLGTIHTFAAYYVAGNGVTGSTWCDGKSWNVSGSLMTEDNGLWSITFSSIPAGSYEFKVTNGVSTWMGFEKFSADCSNLYAVASDQSNINFLLQETQDVTITYNGSVICLKGSVGNNYPDPSKYAQVGVPSEYEGVMLQAFYWDSYKLKTYSNTKYQTLANFADQIGEHFDLVWFPPSGNGGGVGYYTKCYSNLSSDWGNKTQLQAVISTLHDHDCKAIADIVINHFQSASGWAKSFNTNNFDDYGSFKITSEHICAGDEAFTSESSDSRSLAHGNNDTGTNDAGCRDLDHTSEYVQDMCKAYTKWMINTIGFDGFRYDMAMGFAGMYLSEYNLASEPFFSVGEFWSPDISAVKAHLEAASYNTLDFDFPLKYKINNWNGGSSYTNLKNQGLRSVGLSRFAVTFIDNHDTFHRSDNQQYEFIAYNTNLMDKAASILAANAYLLMMPGVPCVFWPHWYTFRSEINYFIDIRKAVGIHSESEVTDETASANSYSATITGHKGKVILRMGSNRDKTLPQGYYKVYAGVDADIYATIELTELEEIKAQNNRPVKIIENGVLYIERNGHRYTGDGIMVK